MDLSINARQSMKDVYMLYLKKWVTIHTYGGGDIFSGKLFKIIDGYGLLYPSLLGEYNKQGKYVRAIKQKIISAPLKDASFEPTTRKSLENYCYFLNHVQEKSNDGK